MVAVPDPEEQNPTGDSAGSRDFDDTDAVFAGIIAGWQNDPDIPRWPADDDQTWAKQDCPPAEPTTERREPSAHQSHREHEDHREHRARDNEDHFEPPEPPPLPVPRPRTVGGVLMLAIGVLLLVQPSVLSLGESAGSPLGLLMLTAGIGWLVLGLRSGPPPDEGPDDGARL